MADPRFKRGARPSPRHKLLAAEPFKKELAAPAQYGFPRPKTDMWGNDQYGDCVSAEEACAKATAAVTPELFIAENTVIAWARDHGFLNGANLTDVMDAMAKDGFGQGGTVYGDGPYKGVDYSNEAVLQAAICVGPVKIAIDANALPQGAGNHDGWTAFGRGNFPNTDHCVNVLWFGPAAFLFGLLNLPVPSGVPSGTLYVVYTWNTFGIVDHEWLMGTCVEAWIRQPTSMNGGMPMPQPDPNPPTPPPPPTPPTPPPPTPTPAPSWWTIILNLLPVILPILISLLQQLQREAQKRADRSTPAR